MIGLIVFTAIFCVSFVGVAIYRRWGLANNILAVPNERSSHSEPTPHGAGIVIAVVCLTAQIPIALWVVGPFSWGYFAGALLVATVSFVDDIHPIRFHWRLLIHSLAAILLIIDLETWHGITMLGNLNLGHFGYLLTFIWIVWMVNSYNFMDGIDGLAALQAVIAAVGWMALGQMLDLYAVYFFCGIIAAASLAFLVHNLSPSKIFMGDVGSAFLGYTFAALPLIGREHVSRSPDLLPIAAVLFVWFFLFDSVITLGRRALKAEKIWLPHKQHLFQRLVRSGYSHRKVALIYGTLATLLSLSVIASVQFREEIGLTMFPVVFVLSAFLIFLCWRRGVLN